MRDVVVELPVDGLPQRVHQAQGGVAVLDLVHHDTQGPHVIDLREFEILGAHLVPDAVDMLGPAVNFGIPYAGLFQFDAQPCHGTVDEGFPLEALLVQHLRDALVGRRLQEPEGKVLDLPFHLPDAEPVGKRCIDFQAFPRHVLPLGRVLVRVPAQGLRPGGKTDHHDPDVVGHREQHLAQDLCLGLDLGSARRRRPGQGAQAFQAMQAGHQFGHRGAETGFQETARIVHAVGHREQQGRQAGVEIQVQRREYQGDRDPMGVGGLAGAQPAVAVRLGGQREGLGYPFTPFGGQALGDPFQDPRVVAGIRQSMDDGDQRTSVNRPSAGRCGTWPSRANPHSCHPDARTSAPSGRCARGGAS